MSSIATEALLPQPRIGQSLAATVLSVFLGFSLTACGGSDEASAPAAPDVSVQKGLSWQFDLKNAASDYTWKTESANVVSVDTKTGIVLAKETGMATVTATASNGDKIVRRIGVTIPKDTGTVSWNGPVISGFAPDPSITKGHDGGYYLVNSSFAMHPGIPVYYSQDMVNWNLVSHAGTKYAITYGSTASLAPGNDGLYAPNLREHNGTYYMTVSNMSKRQDIITTSKNPKDPSSWSEAKIIARPSNMMRFDPDLFFDQDGSTWLTFSAMSFTGKHLGIYTSKINPDTGEVLSEPKYLWDGIAGGTAEGPHLYRIGAYYYLMVAEGGTYDDHMETIARLPVSIGLANASASDWQVLPVNAAAPTVKKNPATIQTAQTNGILNSTGLPPFNPLINNGPSPEISATGHADLIQDRNGNWWAVFLGTRNKVLPNLGRETFLAPVTWVDGWPVVNNGKAITPQMTGPKVDTALPFAPTELDDFTSTTFNLHWNYAYTPTDTSLVSLSKRPGYLALTTAGSATPWGDSSNRAAFLGRRQTSKEMVFTTKMEFAPLNDGEQAGLALIGSTNSGTSTFVVRRETGGGRMLTLTQRDGTVVKTAVSSDTIYLRITCSGQYYTFGYSTNGGVSYNSLARVMSDSIILDPRFAGVYVGMWASSGANGVNTGTSAYFDWASYVVN